MSHIALAASRADIGGPVLMEVGFGDGSFAVESARVRHSYAKAGNYRLVVLMIEPGEVARVTIPVHVSAGLPALNASLVFDRPRLGLTFPDGSRPIVPLPTASG